MHDKDGAPVGKAIMLSFLYKFQLKLKEVGSCFVPSLSPFYCHFPLALC